jgi:hypothetical protein
MGLRNLLPYLYLWGILSLHNYALNNIVSKESLILLKEINC